MFDKALGSVVYYRDHGGRVTAYRISIAVCPVCGSTSHKWVGKVADVDELSMPPIFDAPCDRSRTIEVVLVGMRTP